MVKNHLIIFMSFVFSFSIIGSAYADNVKTTGYFPLKKATYNKLSTTGNTVLGANDIAGPVSIGGTADPNAKLTVTASNEQPDVVVQGELVAKNTLQIEMCRGCATTNPERAPIAVGRIYLDTNVPEEHKDVNS